MSERRLGALGLLAVAGCTPEYRGQGALSVAGQPFAPVHCHVTLQPSGLALEDAAGTRLQLVMSPGVVDAWRSFTVAPQVVVTRAGDAAPGDLGTCGSMTLRGEGWHSDGKRAVSGTLSLACADGVARGDLEFSGCW